MQIKRKFEVRDISSEYEVPTFDVVFNDGEVQRYSEDLFESAKQAAEAIDGYERGEEPKWWDRVDGNEDGDAPMGPPVRRSSMAEA